MARTPRKKLSKDDFKKNSDALKRVFQFLFENYKLHFFVVFVCIIISVLANVQGTLFMQTLIDDYITPMLQSGSNDFGPLAQAIRKVVVFYAIGIIATYIYNYVMVYVSQGSLRKLRNQMFEHMESLPIKYFDTHAHGDIMSTYTNDIDTLRQLISQSIPQIFNSTLTIVAVLVSMIRLSLPLTGITLLMVAIMFVVTGKIAGQSGKYFTKQQKDIATVNGNIEEMMNGQKVVKVFNHEEESIAKFTELNEQLFDS
nr:ABC transporter ATP-binding protein [Lachnospiraceae bacterium]